MTSIIRLAIASRSFCIAAIFGLSLATTDRVAIQSTVVLAAASAAITAVEVSTRASLSWVTTFEGVMAGLVIGLVIPQGLVLLPYLVVPSLLAGLGRGAGLATVVIGAESLSLSLLLALPSGSDQLVEYSEFVAPWLVTGLGVGLLGSWVRQMRGPASHAVDPSYESARRLLSQLRAVARRLSSGLDTGTMSVQLLTTVEQHLHSIGAAVFVRTDGGSLAPIGYQGTSAREALLPYDDTITTCWAEMEPTITPVGSEPPDDRYRTTVPLRVGSRMIGVVLADCADPPSREVLAKLMIDVDEHSLRLDTALAFDEVRSMATVEERQRLAREIHDGVAQEIASLGYVVDELAASATGLEQRERLVDLRRELTRIITELRFSIFDLRSELNASAGLGSTLSDYVRQVGTRSSMTVHLTLDEAPTRLRAEVETEVLRIAQEAITNARKHSGARNMWVDCRIRPPYARIEVRDDGCGQVKPKDDSYGIRIMRERAKRIDAILEIVDAASRLSGTGTRVIVTVGTETPSTVLPTHPKEHA